jgi:hypothetical protein
MAKRDSKGRPSRQAAAGDRTGRLAHELRANLAKRKAQSRARRRNDNEMPGDRMPGGEAGPKP